ncbi:MAG: hypothetical protein WCF90_06615 [Methanomicrobiales archaeon]
MIAIPPAQVTPNDSSTARQPLICWSHFATGRTDDGAMLFSKNLLFSGNAYVPVEVYRTPRSTRIWARVLAVVVFLSEPVISILGCGSHSPSSRRTASW